MGADQLLRHHGFGCLTLRQVPALKNFSLFRQP